MTPASGTTPEGDAASDGAGTSPSAPADDVRDEDIDQQVLRLTWDMAIASLDQVIAPSLADFLH